MDYSLNAADYLVKTPVILEFNATYQLLKKISILISLCWFEPSLNCPSKATGVILVDHQG